MSVRFETRTFDVRFEDDSGFLCSLNTDDEFTVDFGDSVSKQYQGPTTVIPSDSVQVLATANRILTENITIDPIPDNYGLIGWDGSVLTVS